MPYHAMSHTHTHTHKYIYIYVSPHEFLFTTYSVHKKYVNSYSYVNLKPIVPQCAILLNLQYLQ